MAAPPGPGTGAIEQSPAPPDRILHTQVEILYRTSMPGIAGALMAAIILIVTFNLLGGLPSVTGFVWGSLLAANVVFHAVILVLYRRGGSGHDDLFWARLFTLAAFFDGIWWGGATIVLPAPDRFDEQTLVIAVALVVAAGAVPAFASYLPALLFIFLPISVIAAAWQAMQVGLLHQTIAILICVFIVTILILGRRTHANLKEMIQLRFEREQLVETLRQQIEVAQQANAAKSRFLASASHDLRQPVHALGMFVAALGRHPMSHEMRDLVRHIDGSMQSMETLLGSMLDISRLDAGVIDARPRAFAIGPLLQRLGSEHATDAEAKGLVLTVCPCSLFVRSDPVLLERILRNLISNAIRYTDRGRVLIGCRRGEPLRIEVWDTGRGIDAPDRERIFEEFFQVGNPERDRSQGLGLGLSIVRRLTSLLNHRIELESAPGRGSVFRLFVDTAEPVTEAPPADPIETLRTSDLAGVPIAIVDDDPLVLEGMRKLLGGWGADVIAAATGDELTAKLTVASNPPAMILCDLRLRSGEDGIDVIRRVHDLLGRTIPAVLVTGDTASDRVRLAYDSGFHVLHKPIAAGRLRALVGNLIRAGNDQSGMAKRPGSAAPR